MLKINEELRYFTNQVFFANVLRSVGSSGRDMPSDQIKDQVNNHDILRANQIGKIPSERPQLRWLVVV